MAIQARIRPLPIAHYAILLAALVLLILGLFGWHTMDSFRQARDRVGQAAIASAWGELDTVLDVALKRADAIADTFAGWDEVRQQYNAMRYYAYWRKNRMLLAGVVSAHVLAAELYDATGRPLASDQPPGLPAQLSVAELPPPQIHFDDPAEPHLVLFRAVRDDTQAGRPVLGYLGMRMDFLAALRSDHMFRFIDPASIAFSAPASGVISWSGLINTVKFELRTNPLADVVDQMMSRTLVNLAVVVVLTLLLVFPALVLLIVRPLRRISQHIDRLKHASGGLVLDHLGGVMQVLETEKIRRSLNDYQNRLADVHSSLEEKSRELWELAHHDALTGVQNRRAFDEYWQNLPRSLTERGVAVCFALFDINHFKAINDSYGHQIGDHLLTSIAGLISSVLRRGEELFRLGGDEFAMILLDCEPEGALAIAERCQERINAHDFRKIGVLEPVRVAIGLANARASDDRVLHTLHWKADVAMYRAKRPASPHVVVYEDSMAAEGEGLFSSWVNTAVYEAVTKGIGLRMFYQPIVDAQSARIVYYEALVRILRDNEWILPSSIFPIIEARHLEIDLDKVVMRAVLADLDAGVVPLGTGVSINLSGPTVVREQVLEWMRPLTAYLHTHHLVIEVTETALITEIGLANENLGRLREMGFDIALDDFGSGYSSLRYLASMPVDTVKFDISLIRALDDPAQRNIVVHLVRMIKESGHALVAEGIETPATLEIVRALGFNLAQGYLFGAPESQPRQIALFHSASG